MAYTLRLEIKSIHPQRINVDWYNPAVEQCRAFPRTENGVKKAMDKFQKWLKENANFITGAKVVGYEGHHESYKNIPPLFEQIIWEPKT